MFSRLKHMLLDHTTLASALLGLAFPLNGIVVALWQEGLAPSWPNLLAIHTQDFHLQIIWLAPVVLAMFGYFLGKTHTLLKQKMASLELHRQQLDQSQRMEAIGQLASGIAHEINTPVQYIGDNLAALRANLGDIQAFHDALLQNADTAEQTRIRSLAEAYDLAFILEDSPKAIQDALEGVERVSEIVKAMKTFSHVSPTQDRQTIALHDAINSALTLSRNSYKYIADVETDFSPDVGLIECYASELNQVLLNLIINATHAIEEKNDGKGLIRIQTRMASADTVEIQIADNGVGIAKDIQDKVFNLFFTTKDVGKGTGQGLSLAHNVIVQKHGGSLFFTSQPGVGTTFHIHLPLKQADGESA
ncbi:MAG: hypothetical protein KGZ80_03550 [Methylomonas sp.]|nr:hypothetical protein [Methylomonas sp.]